MHSNTDYGTAQPTNGCGPALNERVIAIRHPQALFALPTAPTGVVQSWTQRHCLYEGRWS